MTHDSMRDRTTGDGISAGPSAAPPVAGIEADGRRYELVLPNAAEDHIQKLLMQTGRPYELGMLQDMHARLAPGDLVLDIGANVGNHTLYAALFLKAAQVIPIEPNPVAYRLLVQNVLVNRLSDVVDLSRLGVGVSDKRAGGYAMEPRRTNLGAAKMLDGAGEIEVWPAAELLDGVAPDLVKIDVEGMEMLVLSGLEPVLAAHRPVVLVEVQLENEAAFFDWLAAQGYGVVATHQRYKENRNQLIAEAGRVEALKAAWGPGEDPAQTVPAKDMETAS